MTVERGLLRMARILWSCSDYNGIRWPTIEQDSIVIFVSASKRCLDHRAAKVHSGLVHRAHSSVDGTKSAMGQFHERLKPPEDCDQLEHCRRMHKQHG